MKTRYIIIFLHLVSFFAQAQQSLRFRRLNVNDGLSQNTVIAITQDHNGFMWMATQDGLNRYDGYSFKVYRHIEKDSTSLSNNYVICLAVDKGGNVWAGTTNGLNKIDGKTGQVTRIDLSAVLKNADNYRIQTIVGAENGQVFFGMNWGLFCIDSTGNVRQITSIGRNVPAYQLHIQKNKLWIGTRSDIICYDYTLDKVTGIPVSGKEEMTLLQVKNNLILFSSQEKLYRYDIGASSVTNVYSRYVSPGGIAGKVLSIYTDGNNAWMSTQNGLIWQRGNDTLLIKHLEEYEYSLSSDFVYSVYKDRSGFYWIGTSRGGLCIFNPAWQNFKIISKPLNLHAAVWHIAEKGDTLFLATAKGLKVYRKKKGISRISASFLPEQAIDEIELPGLQNALKDLLLTSVCIDARRRLWIGTETNGAYLYNFITKELLEFKHSALDSASLSSNNVLHLDTLTSSTIGVSGPIGFSEIDINTLKINSVYLTRLHKNVTNNYTLKSWREQGNTWMSCACGLCILDPKTGYVQQFLPDEKHPAEQYHNIVSDVMKDQQHRYWVSTLGFGLFNYDPVTGKSKKFGMEQGLKNETILGLLPGTSGALWLGTNEGLATFDLTTCTFESLDASEGLYSKECTKNGFYKSTNGDLFFGTMSGLMVVDPEQIVRDKHPLKTVLTGIKINYQTLENRSEYISGSNYSPKALNIDHTVKTISFEFSALHFSGADNVQYKYKLQGFNDAWVRVTSADRTAIYTNLPPKTYTFTVVPLLNGKEMKENALSFVIHVKPPFWLSWWFLLLALANGILLISFTVRYYSQRKLKNKLKQAEEQQKLQKEKERISRELHDNVGSQLTYIIKSLDNLSYKSEHSTTNMVKQLDALGDFSRDTLSQLRESIWAINSKEISLKELIAKIHEYVNKINGSFERTLIHVEAFDTSDTALTPTAAINSFRILQEAITNSLKYSEADHIHIKIEQHDLNLEFGISDNGKGFEPGSLQRKGYGLENMRARAAELGTEFLIRSVPGSGTDINFSVPIQ